MPRPVYFILLLYGYSAVKRLFFKGIVVVVVIRLIFVVETVDVL